MRPGPLWTLPSRPLSFPLWRVALLAAVLAFGCASEDEAGRAGGAHEDEAPDQGTDVGGQDATTATVAPGQVPAGLAARDWSQIRLTIEDDLQRTARRIERAGASHRLTHRAAGLSAQITTNGELRVAGLEHDPTETAVSLALSSYGRQGAMLDVDAPRQARLGDDRMRLDQRRGDSLTEWFASDTRGLQQGFVVETRPDGRGALRIALTVEGAELEASGTEATLTAGDHEFTYGGLIAWDATGRALDAEMLAVDGELVLAVDDAGASYPVTIDPWLEDAKLTASDAAGGDQFGYSVAVSGDLVVVGAFGDDDAGSASGSAYVFEVGTGLGEVTKLTAGDAAASGDQFGRSVAVSGDTIVIGAHNNGGGAAYVFDAGSGFAEVARLTASDAASGDQFGTAVAVSGDTIVVGAPVEGALGGGSAYVYDAGSGFAEVAKLEVAATVAGDEFGSAVAVSGDLVVVGVPGDDDDGLSSGSVYVFDAASSYGQVAKLTASDAADGDQFGISVAVSGAIVVAGARFADGQGAAYTFDAANGFSEVARLTASDGASGDQYGYSVAVSGAIVVVGTRFGGGGDGGTAYVYDAGSGYAEVAGLTAGDAAASDQFGLSVAVSGSTIAVGAPGDDDAGNNSGSAYVFFAPSMLTDRSARRVLVDGTFVASEYPTGFTAGVGSGFGNMIGLGTRLHAEGDALGGLTFALEGSQSVCSPNDHIVIYIDSVAGGFASTAPLTDNVDLGRAAASGVGRSTGSSDLTFAPGFEADYAIVVSSATVSLFHLEDDADGHTFVRSLDRGFTGPFCDQELGGAGLLGELGLTPGDRFRYVVTLLNADNGFRADEFHGVASTTVSGGSPGANPVVLTTNDYVTFQTLSVVLNEVDADTPGTDLAEFVELRTNHGADLSGLVLVMYNGSDASDGVSAAVDLAGSTGTDALFLLGGSTVTGAEQTLADGTLQNGADAVALYVGSAADFPNGTAPTTANLVDALVYGTDDAPDAALLTALGMAGQRQANESARGDATLDSNQRCASQPLYSDGFAARTPTPGAMNDCPATCAAWLASGADVDGLYAVDDSGTTLVYCDQTTDGGGWTLASKFSQHQSIQFMPQGTYDDFFKDGDASGDIWIEGHSEGIPTSPVPDYSTYHVESHDWRQLLTPGGAYQLRQQLRNDTIGQEIDLRFDFTFNGVVVQNDTAVESDRAWTLTDRAVINDTSSVVWDTADAEPIRFWLPIQPGVTGNVFMGCAGYAFGNGDAICSLSSVGSRRYGNAGVIQNPDSADIGVSWMPHTNADSFYDFGYIHQGPEDWRRSGSDDMVAMYWLREVSPPAVCGNGVPEPGEDCDTSGESASCDADCTAVVCGDGAVNASANERCDDGNTTGGDGCSASCLIETGGPCTGGVDCESGVCSGNVCQAPSCGDGVTNGAEACDTGGESASCDRTAHPSCVEISTRTSPPVRAATMATRRAATAATASARPKTTPPARAMPTAPATPVVSTRTTNRSASSPTSAATASTRKPTVSTAMWARWRAGRPTCAGPAASSSTGRRATRRLAAMRRARAASAIARSRATGTRAPASRPTPAATAARRAPRAATTATTPTATAATACAAPSWAAPVTRTATACRASVTSISAPWSPMERAAAQMRSASAACAATTPATTASACRPTSAATASSRPVSRAMSARRRVARPARTIADSVTASLVAATRPCARAACATTRSRPRSARTPTSAATVSSTLAKPATMATRARTTAARRRVCARTARAAPTVCSAPGSATRRAPISAKTRTRGRRVL